MFEALKKLLGLKTTNYARLMQDGAVIIDVRTSGEFSSGHIQNSINIPVDKLPHQLNKLKSKEKPIITCCASGMRSAAAKNILKSNGFAHVYNGGAWHSLKNKIR